MNDQEEISDDVLISLRKGDGQAIADGLWKLHGALKASHNAMVGGPHLMNPSVLSVFAVLADMFARRSPASRQLILKERRKLGRKPSREKALRDIEVALDVSRIRIRRYQDAIDRGGTEKSDQIILKEEETYYIVSMGHGIAQDTVRKIVNEWDARLGADAAPIGNAMLGRAPPKRGRRKKAANGT